MTYTHFGKQADVLKHLLLCELLRIEMLPARNTPWKERPNRSTASTTF